MKRYPSGLITADPVTLGSSSNGYIVSSTDQLQYNFSGVWPIAPLPPFPTYTSLSYSNSFDGNGDYLTYPEIIIGAGQFTVEAWVYLTQSTDATVFSTGRFWFKFYSATSISLVQGGVVDILTASSLPSVLNTWAHIAVTRNSANLIQIWLNGVSVASVTNSVSFDTVTSTGKIGIESGSLIQPFYGYISNLRVVKGQAVYTGNFTVPTSPLALTQSSSSNVASIINTIPSNGGSVYFDGTGDYLSVPNINFSTNPYTIEGWFYITATSVPSNINFWGTDNGSGAQPKMVLVADGTQFQLLCNNGGDASIAVNHGGLAVSRWHHIAVVKEGTSANQHKIYLNGTALNSTSAAWGSLSSITATFNIGYIGEGFGSVFQGYISNFRIVNGTALYTSNFTPPTSSLTAITNTSLLTCQSSTIIDNRSSPLTITVTGDTKVALTDSPFGVSNVKLLTAQSPTVIDNSLNNFTITVNGDTKALALSPFDTTLRTAYLAVAGGGGGGGQGGGGGAGGLLYRTNLILVPNVTYTITIGAGGTTSAGSSFGSDSKITNAGFAANITAIGGGAGQSRDITVPGGVGGSGGGGGAGASGGNATGQAGTPGQGNSGAPGGFPSGGGGGGGAGGAGNGGSPYAGNGGIGVYLTISGSNVAYAGGGGGGGVGGYNSGGGAGGIGGGGGGSHGTTGGGGFPGGTLSTTAAPGTYGPGAINTGGGGGGAVYLGGSGIVILASNIYQASNVTGNPNVTYDYGNSVAIYRFWQSGTIKW